MELTRADAQKDGVHVPETLEEYCIKTKPKPEDDCLDALDMDEDYFDGCEDSDGDDGDDSEAEEAAEDSGQGEN